MNAGIVKRALEEAEISPYYPYKIGAVIFSKNRILGSGHNDIRCNSIHPKYKNFENSLHAEQAAILSVKDWSVLKGSSIFVIRMNLTGNISMAKPCDMCMSMIKHVGIKKIYYTNRFGETILERI
jgi:deoxycytidylate deaminase